MASSCAKSEYTIVLRFKRKSQCVNISAPYFQAFLAMTSFFDEQYPKNEWNDFINSNYAIDYEDSTLFSSLDCFVSHGILELNTWLTIDF